jgi:hypothetical protein
MHPPTCSPKKFAFVFQAYSLTVRHATVKQIPDALPLYS